MTHDILPSDVAFARGLLKGIQPDSEIINSLAARSIEPAKAAQLIDDLRHGRDPKVQMHFVLGVRPKEANPPATPQVPVTAPSAPRRKKHKRSRVSWWAIALGMIVLWAIWYAWLKLGADASRDLHELDKHRLPDPPTKDLQR
jgi:hypothetical protein